MAARTRPDLSPFLPEWNPSIALHSICDLPAGENLIAAFCLQIQQRNCADFVVIVYQQSVRCVEASSSHCELLEGVQSVISADFHPASQKLALCQLSNAESKLLLYQFQSPGLRHLSTFPIAKEATRLRFCSESMVVAGYTDSCSYIHLNTGQEEPLSVSGTELVAICTNSLFKYAVIGFKNAILVKFSNATHKLEQFHGELERMEVLERLNLLFVLERRRGKLYVSVWDLQKRLRLTQGDFTHIGNPISFTIFPYLKSTRRVFLLFLSSQDQSMNESTHLSGISGFHLAQFCPSPLFLSTSCSMSHQNALIAAVQGCDYTPFLYFLSNCGLFRAEKQSLLPVSSSESLSDLLLETNDSDFFRLFRDSLKPLSVADCGLKESLIEAVRRCATNGEVLAQNPKSC